MTNQRFESTPHFTVGDDPVIIQSSTGSTSQMLVMKNPAGDVVTSIGHSGSISSSSPEFTGTPTAPTAASGTNTTQIATTAFVQTEVSNLVASAPATLNTLDELAAALGDDSNFATTTATAIGLKAPLASPTFTGTVSGISKSMVGLGSVDNTADTAKPVSTAQQTALNLKANIAGPTFTGTVTASTVNSSNYQQGGNAGSIVRSAAVTVPFNTSNQLHLVNMPSGCTVFNLINVHPTTGVNNTVTITEIRYGDWSGVQSTTQIGLTGYLGNGVHTEATYVTFFWLA